MESNPLFLDISRRLNALERIRGREGSWTEGSVSRACRTAEGRAKVDALVSEYHLIRFVPKSDIVRGRRSSVFHRLLGIN